ncbi:hypothetical protein K6M90_28735 [Rhizobium sp. 9T]|uniref:hypothetical protein n=1 Tax=Rhizobium croatiense TaxID=2867516 RepID=UPI001C933722|nr:hypothetical protein [Rhizobium croatiense]MBY4611614.1 hypothetical protein [Rhizobium croatiense]
MSLGWGNWDVRVYAALSWVSLASQYAEENPIIIDRLDACLHDPAATVRLQVASRLDLIPATSADQMWAMATRLASAEPNLEVLTALLNGPLYAFALVEPEKCEELLVIVKNRLETGAFEKAEDCNLLFETFGGWTAQLFAAQGRALARDWLEQWCRNPQGNAEALNAFSSSVRNVLFEKYNPEAAEEAIAASERACDGITSILKASLQRCDEAYKELTAEQGGSMDRDEAVSSYQTCSKIVDHVAKQLYFGSGAFKKSKAEKAGLSDTAAMRQFLNDYQSPLELLGRSREPRTIHHLVELYEFLVPADPARVFDAIHTVVGQAREGGYHLENLAASVVVRLVRQYIADHRPLFDDSHRREQLVAILRIFSDVGWPSAMTLLFDLPDLMR